MRLRHQLILISALTLVLPWAGCESIRELEQTLRQEQSEALNAHARAAALAIANQAELVSTLKRSAGAEQPLYLNPLPSAPIVDGYDEDWRLRELIPQQLTQTPASQVTAGFHGQRIYLLLNVERANPRYCMPGRAALKCDHVTIETPNGKVWLLPEAPGELSGRNPAAGQSWQLQPQVRGVWREGNTGYQLELTLPDRWANEGLGITVISADGEQAGNIAGGAPPPPSISPQPHLYDLLSIFAGPNLRLQVVDKQEWLLASAGSTEFQATTANRHWLLQRFYRWLLRDRADLPVASTVKAGKLQRPESQQALSGQAAWHRYRTAAKDGALLSTAYPITDHQNAVIGAVLAEENTQRQLALTNTALQRLLLVGLGATLLVAAALLSYASWLSWRIRRLNQASQRVMDANGRLSRSFPERWGNDELGDLGHSFHRLFGQLHEYTEYLRTLASKLSHELRTPLAVVRSSLDNLEFSVDQNDSGSTYLTRAREGSERLSQLLTAMSEANRVEASIQSADTQTLSLNDLLRDIGHAYQDLYQTHNIQLAICDEPVLATVAPELLVQALDKLIDNATDFCPSGGLIELSLTRQNQYAVVTIGNDGPPLPGTMEGQLFESMVSVRDRADHSTHLGLGLYIVRLIAEFHHAEIHARNRSDNSGVLFSLHLPLSD